MKRVSFKVAKAIKEAGYLQIGEYWYDGSGLCCYSESDLDELQNHFYAAPYALEVWLWLWKEKKIFIDTESDKYYGNEAFTKVSAWDENIDALYEDDNQYISPEEAIIAAIDYLVDRNLIK